MRCCRSKKLFRTSRKLVCTSNMRFGRSGSPCRIPKFVVWTRCGVVGDRVRCVGPADQCSVIPFDHSLTRTPGLDIPHRLQPWQEWFQLRKRAPNPHVTGGSFPIGEAGTVGPISCQNASVADPLGITPAFQESRMFFCPRSGARLRSSLPSNPDLRGSAALRDEAGW